MQTGTTVVFLIDDTSSLDGRKPQLKQAFNTMLNGIKTDHNVRVAALRHGHDHVFRTSLSASERVNLGGRRGGPYMFSPVPTPQLTPQLTPQRRPIRLLTNPTPPFKTPGQLLAGTTVTDAIDDLDLTGRTEYLYPGIALAREMIEKECLPPTPSSTPGVGTPTPTPKPWCSHKVIVVLGDGDPGLSDNDYHASSPRVHDVLPEKELDKIAGLGIELHTVCIGNCTWEIIRFSASRLYNSLPRIIHRGFWYTGYRGGDVMREIAKYTGGEFHGHVP